MEIRIMNSSKELKENLSEEKVINFLYEHLDEFGDEKKAIKKSIDYAFSDDKGKGGFMVTASEDGVLVGVVVMNHTGMSDFIPEYYLVYVAVHKNVRGKGIGGKIIKQAIEHAETDVALHVEYDNPAKKLYERLGFESKYAEMRYSK